MDLLWFLLGIAIVVGGWYVLKSKRPMFKTAEWVLLAAAVALGLVTIAFVSTMLTEPLPGAPRAAGIGALIFGGITVILGVVLGRRLGVKKT
jgi:hypothetical protein